MGQIIQITKITQDLNRTNRGLLFVPFVRCSRICKMASRIRNFLIAGISCSNDTNTEYKPVHVILLTYTDLILVWMQLIKAKTDELCCLNENSFCLWWMAAWLKLILISIYLVTGSLFLHSNYNTKLYRWK